MPALGDVRGFDCASRNSTEVKIENDLMILDGAPFGSKRLAEVLLAAMIGKDVIVLHGKYYDYCCYLRAGEIPDEQINVTNGNVFRLFDGNFAEIHSDEKAYEDIRLVFIQVESYPCKIQTTTEIETLVVEKDNFHHFQE